MKSSTKYFMALGVSALALPAMAQTTFEESKFEGFPQIHRTSPVAGDFTNNGYLDIYHGGQYDPELNLPGIYIWTPTSTFIFNEGNDFFKVDKWTAEINQEPQKDQEGNPILDPETGEPIYEWHMAAPEHIIRIGTEDSNVAFDYNNDGFLDLLVFAHNGSDDWTGLGDEWKTDHITLYKNNGDGTFSMVEETGFPIARPDNGGAPISIAAGDYDRDGFVDILVSGIDVPRGEGEDLMPGRLMGLFRNINGSGKFERMHIATVKGGVWTNEQKTPDEKDEAGNIITPGEVIVPRQELPGWFAPCSGNVIFADLNNDGWLDIINTGWMDDCHIGDRKGGSRTFIYLNHEGKEFVEVTPSDFMSLRSSGIAVADFDFDGYYDIFFPGYSDIEGVDWEAYLYTNSQDEDAMFDMPQTSVEIGLEGTEQLHPVIRDFDGDGNLDIYYNGKDENCHMRIFYGDAYGNFKKYVQEETYLQGMWGCPGDFNNDGLTDIFHTGWYYRDNLHYNTGEVEAPTAPTDVKVEYADGLLNISWNYDEATAIEEALAYNVYVKNSNGTYCLLPADIETGFLKVADGKHVALRPNQMSYSIATDVAEAEVGVQAISLKNETYSPFTKAATAGVKTISADKAIKNLKVTVAENGIIVAGNGEWVNVFNAQGQKVAAGVAGELIALDGNGIYVVATANGSAKVMK